MLSHRGLRLAYCRLMQVQTTCSVFKEQQTNKNPAGLYLVVAERESPFPKMLSDAALVRQLIGGSLPACEKILQISRPARARATRGIVALPVLQRENRACDDRSYDFLATPVTLLWGSTLAHQLGIIGPKTTRHQCRRPGEMRSIQARSISRPIGACVSFSGLITSNRHFPCLSTSCLSIYDLRATSTRRLDLALAQEACSERGWFCARCAPSFWPRCMGADRHARARSRALPLCPPFPA
jgi:hypothetical protein